MHPNTATPDPTVVPDPLPAEVGRRLAALGRRLDAYLGAVARELRALGVITDSPRRTDPTGRLIGSIVIDCTALRVAGDPIPDHPIPDHSIPCHPIPGQRRPRGERPVRTDLPITGSQPVVITWDEVTGWCAGLHDDAASSSRRYLHQGLLPAAAVVATFVVDLAQGRPVGSVGPLGGVVPTRARRQLRVV